MNIKNRLQFSWLRVGPDEPLDLKSLRNWLVNVIMFFGAFTGPLAMLVTFPVFIAEKHYGLIVFDVIIWLLVIIGIFTKASTYQVRAYFLLAILYTMTIIFFIALGPHHARSGWLVMCSVMAAVMFGVHAATVSATINAAVLMLLYLLMGPENQVWASEYTAPFRNWVMFVVNIFLITLASSLPVGFLLNRLDRSLNSEKETSVKLSVKSEKLQTAYIALQDEIEEHKKSKEILKESQRYARELIEASPDALVMISADGKVTDVNHATELITGTFRKEIIGTDFANYFTDPDAAESGYQQVFKDNYVRDYPLEIKHIDGRVMPVLYNATVYKDAQGQIAGVFAAARDITERKQTEEKIQESLKEKEVLLQEVHHRVKNNMQVISSLLKLQASFVKDKRVTDALLDCQGRVQAMAFVHETIYGSDRLSAIDFKTYVFRLADKLFHFYSTGMDRVKLKADIEKIKLGIEQATPLGLIFSELISNSLKYAFSKNQHGEIFVSLRIVEQDTVEFIFSDSGIGIPEDLDWRNTDSLGLQLIILLAEDQLDGTVNLNRDNGTRFTIKFSLEENK